MLGLVIPPKRTVEEGSFLKEVRSVTLTQTLDKPFKKIVIENSIRKDTMSIKSHFNVTVDDESVLITKSLSKAVAEYNKH